MKKSLFAIPVLGAAAASFASTGSTAPSWATAANVESATDGLVTWGGLIIAGIGGVVAAAAGLRLLVKGINRAVGK